MDGRPVFVPRQKMHVTMTMLASATGMGPATIMFHPRPDGWIADPGLRDLVAACCRHHELRHQAKRKGRPGWKRGAR